MPFCCHKKQERCFKFKDKCLPLCARCCGFFVSFPLGIAFLILNVNFNKTLSFCLIAWLIAPALIDWSLQYFLKVESNNVRRFCTGLAAGIGIAIFCGDHF